MKLYLFLKNKFGNYSIKYMFFNQIESFLVWLFNFLPTIIGFILRFAIYKLLFKKLKGFPWIQPNVQIVNSNKLTVGKMFGVNSGTYINAIGGINIGNFVLIGSNATISSGMHPIDNIDHEIFSEPVIPKEINIEDDVWIGAGAVIMPGVTLKKGCVIGANAVVTKDTEEYGVFAGIPAKKIRDRIIRKRVIK